MRSLLFNDMAGRRLSVGHVSIFDTFARRLKPERHISLANKKNRTVVAATALRRRLVAAVAVSSLGDGLVLVAFPLLAVRLTTNALLISGLVVAARLPWLIVALPAGAAVDRADRRRLTTAVELARGVVVAAVAIGTLTTTLPIEALYAATFLIGAGETVVSAAVRATIPFVAAGDEVITANGHVNAAHTAGAQFAGPALGGVIFSIAAPLPFVGDAISYVASAIVLRTTMPHSSGPATHPRARLVTDIRTGLRWFLANPSLRVLAVVVTSFAFCQAMVFAVLVLFATRDLHLGPAGYGLLLGVAAIGDVVASLLAHRIHDFLGPYGTILVAGAVAAGGYLLLSSTSDTYFAAFALTIEAAASSLGNVATLTARHRIIPNERFGLINNAFRMSVTGLIPIGALTGGALATLLGLRTTFLIAGLIQLVILTAMALRLRLVLPPSLSAGQP